MGALTAGGWIFADGSSELASIGDLVIWTECVRYEAGSPPALRQNQERIVIDVNRFGWLVAVALIGSPLAAGSATAQTPAEKGAAVFVAQKCSLCHALDGKGNAKGPLDGVGTKWTAAEIRQWIVAPAEMTAKANATRKPAMKAFPTLPKDDLDALVAFLSAKKK